MIAHPGLARAAALHRTGALMEAEAAYADYLAADPTNIAALNDSAALALQLGKAGVAIERFRTLVGLTPDVAHAHNNLGFALTVAGRPEEAISHLQKAVEIDSGYTLAQNNLGIAFERSERRADAIEAFQRALRAEPASVEIAANLGEVLLRDDQPERARVSLLRALSLQPGHLGARIALATVEALDGNLSSARASLEALAPSNPKHAKFWYNLSLLRAWAGEDQNAEEARSRASRLDPRDPAVRFSVAAHLLAHRDYSEGWRAFENRREGEFGTQRRYTQFPRWDGASIRTLLIHCEQGLGDNIQFMRFVKEARNRAERIVVVAAGYWRSLAPIFSTLEGVDAVYSDETDALSAEEIAGSTSLLSLPFYLRANDERADQVPYLRAPPARIQQWAERLGHARGKKVGIVWSSSARRELGYSRLKSIPVDLLPSIIATPNIQFVSLQLGGMPTLATMGESGLRVLDFSVDIKDFADTAGIISSLDLVVSIDTSVAHVAGAMGKPTLLLDRYNADWRWRPIDGGRAQWYPSVRLFRQSKFGDWTDPIAQVLAVLTDSR